MPAFSWIWLAAAVCLRVARISVQFIFTCIDRVEPDRATPAVELHESVRIASAGGSTGTLQNRPTSESLPKSANCPVLQPP